MALPVTQAYPGAPTPTNRAPVPAMGGATPSGAAGFPVGFHMGIPAGMPGMPTMPYTGQLQYPQTAGQMTGQLIQSGVETVSSHACRRTPIVRITRYVYVDV
jgi:hypothetical protein